MGINNPMFSSRTVEDDPTCIIQMKAERPALRTRLDPPEQPNKMVGYYNPANGSVELYVTSSTGEYYLNVTG